MWKYVVYLTNVEFFFSSQRYPNLCVVDLFSIFMLIIYENIWLTWPNTNNNSTTKYTSHTSYTNCIRYINILKCTCCTVFCSLDL